MTRVPFSLRKQCFKNASCSYQDFVPTDAANATGRVQMKNFNSLSWDHPLPRMPKRSSSDICILKEACLSAGGVSQTIWERSGCRASTLLCHHNPLRPINHFTLLLRLPLIFGAMTAMDSLQFYNQYYPHFTSCTLITCLRMISYTEAQ